MREGGRDERRMKEGGMREGGRDDRGRYLRGPWSPAWLHQSGSHQSPAATLSLQTVLTHTHSHTTSTNDCQTSYAHTHDMYKPATEQICPQGNWRQAGCDGWS